MLSEASEVLKDHFYNSDILVVSFLWNWDA